MDAKQFKHLIVRPVLDHLGIGGLAAVNLITGTAIIESGLDYVRQLPDGPALGLFQMEPNTHTDIWVNYLRYKPQLAARVRELMCLALPDEQNLIVNNAYAAAMCRVHYLRVQERMPGHDNPVALARYHKQWYNTPLGKTNVEKSIPLFRLAVGL